MDRLFHLRLALPTGEYDRAAIDQHLRETIGGLMVAWVESRDQRRKPSLMNVCGRVSSWDFQSDCLVVNFKPYGPLRHQLVVADDQGLSFHLSGELIRRRLPDGRNLVVGVTALTVYTK